MKMSMGMFLGGAVFGAFVVVFLLSSGAFSAASGSREQYDSQIPDRQLDELADAVIALKIAATSLQKSAEKFASLSSASIADNNQNHEAAGGTQSGSLVDQIPMLPSAIATPPAPGETHVVGQTQSEIPPTSEQVEHYYLLQRRLYDAAYDHSAVLSELTQQSNQLTSTQRQELVSEAMDMVKRGELEVEQFMPQPKLEAE